MKKLNLRGVSVTCESRKIHNDVCDILEEKYGWHPDGADRREYRGPGEFSHITLMAEGRHMTRVRDANDGGRVGMSGRDLVAAHNDFPPAICVTGLTGTQRRVLLNLAAEAGFANTSVTGTTLAFYDLRILPCHDYSKTYNRCVKALRNLPRAGGHTTRVTYTKAVAWLGKVLDQGMTEVPQGFDIRLGSKTYSVTKNGFTHDGVNITARMIDDFLTKFKSLDGAPLGGQNVQLKGEVRLGCFRPTADQIRAFAAKWTELNS